VIKEDIAYEGNLRQWCRVYVNGNLSENATCNSENTFSSSCPQKPRKSKEWPPIMSATLKGHAMLLYYEFVECETHTNFERTSTATGLLTTAAISSVTGLLF